MGYMFKYRPEWGKLLVTFGALDLGKTHIYERQLVETFPRDPVEYLSITPEWAAELVERYEKSSFYYSLAIKVRNEK